MTKALIELKPGERGRVVKIRGPGDFHHRLASAGLTVGRILDINVVQPKECVGVMIGGASLPLLGKRCPEFTWR